MLLEPADWSLAQSGDDVLARLSDELSPHTSPETHAAVVELATAIHPDVDGVVAELTSLRNRLSRELDAMGLTVAAAGTHPLTPGGDRGAGATRYAHSTTRCACSPGASRRWPCTCTSARRIPRTRSGFSTGCATESRFCLRCRPTLRTGRARFRVPVSAHRDLLGLSTRRPATVFRRLRRLRRHDRRADRLRGDTRSELLVVGRAAAARARDRRGQGDGRPVNGQGGHFPGRAGQSPARLELDGEPSSSVVPSAEVLAENRFLAAQDGMDARLIDPAAGCPSRCERCSTRCCPIVVRTRSRSGAPVRLIGWRGSRPQTAPPVSAS
jgi:hypothetical protein